MKCLAAPSARWRIFLQMRNTTKTTVGFLNGGPELGPGQGVRLCRTCPTVWPTQTMQQTLATERRCQGVVGRWRGLATRRRVRRTFAPVKASRAWSIHSMGGAGEPPGIRPLLTDPPSPGSLSNCQKEIKPISHLSKTNQLLNTPSGGGVAGQNCSK